VAISESRRVSTASWLSSLGLETNPDFSPRTADPRLAIVLRCEDSSAAEIATTINDLLQSTFQDYSVQIVDSEAHRTNLSEWLGADSRFSLVDSRTRTVPPGRFILVVHAGWRLTRYSLEALLEAIQSPGVHVVRALTEGRRESLEVWDSVFLQSGPLHEAENHARVCGFERWMSGMDAGIYAYGKPVPKVFFRKGKADRHIIEFSISRSKSAARAKPHSWRVTELEREIERLRAIVSSRPIRSDHRIASWLPRLRRRLEQLVRKTLFVSRVRRPEQ
jgi:hypothetical protein